MLAPGAVVAGYRIESVLGSGGMGTVYLAADPVLPRRVALKVLSGELSKDPAFRARFVKEADLAATLEHSNIVAVHSRGETEQGQLWIAMQYVAGSDADTEVKSGRMSPARAVHVVTEVAKALDYAHRRGVIHRDVKPANFLLADSDDRVFLADFGIARAFDDSAGLTATGTVVGSIAYSAPELFAEQRIDGRADIYSLGCALYQMLAGRPPFAGAGAAAATIAAHLSAPPPRVTDANSQLPAALNAVVAIAMQKQPDQRYQTALDLAAAAAAGLRGGSAPAPAAGGTTTVVTARPRRATGKRLAAVAASAVLLAATVTAVTLHGHRPTGGGTAAGPTEAAADAPNVALLDTGDYAITAAQVPKPRPDTGKAFEGMRLADYVVGPWAEDRAVSAFPPLIHPFGYLPTPDMVVQNLQEALPGLSEDVLTSHGYITGFFGERSANPDGNKFRIAHLGNMVLILPDHDSAVVVAKELAAKLPMASTQFFMKKHPDTLAFAYQGGEFGFNVGFTAFGPYVIYQTANGLLDPQATDPYANIKNFVETYLEAQKLRLGQFSPTAPDKLIDAAEQTIAAAGPLFGNTLRAPDKNTPGNIGLWKPPGWLFFESDPLRAKALLEQNGVQWVSQFLATVYAADTDEHAERLAQNLAIDMENTPNVHPTAKGVPGFPAARCFERTQDFSTDADAMSWQRIRWHFKCVATTGHHVFTTFSDVETAAKQQLSAQYRILAGR